MKPGQRHRNLVYVRLWWQLGPIGITIFIVSLVGYLGLPEDDPQRIAVGSVGGLTLLISLLTLVYARRAHVQCRKTGLRLRYPFYTLDVPYVNIESTRLTTLDRFIVSQIEANKRRKPSWSEGKFLEPLLGEHVIVVQFQELPRPYTWLRLWIGRRWLGRNSIALVIRDWLSLRQDLDTRIVAAQEGLHRHITHPYG